MDSKKRKMTQRNAFFLALLVSSLVGTALLGGWVKANEVMTDRCGADVAFPKSYDTHPISDGAMFLTRKGVSETKWSLPFRVVTNRDGYIRWWCNSTTGNWFDPGTWFLEKLVVGAKCDDRGCRPTIDFSIKPPYTTISGWTAEKSRCDNRSSVIRARLGRDRLLEIECLPAETGSSTHPVSLRDCSYGPQTCVNGFVWRGAGPNDYACVHPAVREQTWIDNGEAASRRNPYGGPYGPNTCLDGYVWREAFPNDFACVTPETRAQAWFDNAHQDERQACK